ncbi:MAG: DUF4245 domain-containing protein [Micrococcales bacterium]|nr:DUF4245 domain-containing protein [Micrococcales bacterium]
MSGPRPDDRRIVAELGRPESPQEAADRKAESRRQRRANQTAFNLVIALVASLAVVAFLVIVVVRPDRQSLVEPVDWRAVADQAQQDSPRPLLVPRLSDGWAANRAEWNGDPADGVPVWDVGWVTPAKQYAALAQGIRGTDAWVADRLGKTRATGAVTIAGVDWTVYDRRDADDPGNLAYALAAELNGSRVVLSGTASTGEFRTLATAVATDSRRSP